MEKSVAQAAAQILDELRSAAAVDSKLEDEFNRLSEARHLNLYLRRGRLYPAVNGHSHTAVLAS